MALAITLVLTVGVGLTTADYRQEDRQQDQNLPWQAPSQDQSQQQGDRQSRQPGRGQGQQQRNVQLEQQIASQLEEQGFGAQGEIMILATGNQVILLGTVPSQSQSRQVEQAVQQAASGLQVDNRLHARAQARRVPDEQLQSSIQDQLPQDLSSDVRIQARNGTVTMQGQVDSWTQMADAIDAAFAAGATQVNSQLNVSGMAAAGGQGQIYGYQPGQRPPQQQQS